MRLLVRLADYRETPAESAEPAFLVLGQLGGIQDDRLGAGRKGHEAVVLAPGAEHFPVVLIGPPRGIGARGTERLLGLL